MEKDRPDAVSTRKSRKIVDLLPMEHLMPPQVGTNRRLEWPLKRVVLNLLKLKVNPHIVAAACGLSYSSVMYHSRKIRFGSGRAGKAK